MTMMKWERIINFEEEEEEKEEEETNKRHHQAAEPRQKSFLHAATRLTTQRAMQHLRGGPSSDPARHHKQLGRGKLRLSKAHTQLYQGFLFLFPREKRSNRITWPTSSCMQHRR